MLPTIQQLPHRNFGFSFWRPGTPTAPCQVGSIGLTLEQDSQRYRFDNRNRSDFCLFQYTISGEGRLEDLNTGQTTVLTPGQGFLVPFPSNTRYWLPEGKTWEFIYICFCGPLAFDHCHSLIRQYGHLYTLALTSRPLELLWEIYHSALSENGTEPFTTSARLYAFLMELYCERKPVPAQFPAGIRLAKQHIDEHVTDANLGVDVIAQASGYSKYHFSRLFRRHVGLSPYAYLLQGRLRRALELVATTKIPVKQIANMTGFRDYSYFCNAFHKHFGRTPATARREQHALGVSEILSEERTPRCHIGPIAAAESTCRTPVSPDCGAH